MNETLFSRIKYAFIHSLPVLCGYLFLGTAFGILLQNAGYNFVWAFFMSLFIYAGSMQFIMVPMMVAAVSPLTMAITTIFVNSRHMFYGISFIEEFHKLKGKLYMIFSLTDETYSVLYSCKAIDHRKKHHDSWFFISLFDHLYWITGCVLGTLIGEWVPIDFTGIDFSMTALFVVILIEQILGKGKIIKQAAFIGFLSGIICLFIFGGDNFLLPSLIITVILLSGYSLKS
ncbi:MAG: AzlC family ABC transporter permease [Lachnospiraceae bacterium]